VSISPETRQLVRERAGLACEYCGVTETDTGGELTVDHFQPRACEGGDDPENLLYCCPRCNQYKADYWPAGPDDPRLLNPRWEKMDGHLLHLADGTLYPITSAVPGGGRAASSAVSRPARRTRATAPTARCVVDRARGPPRRTACLTHSASRPNRVKVSAGPPLGTSRFTQRPSHSLHHSIRAAIVDYAGGALPAGLTVGRVTLPPRQAG
jgi:hypothetical protein